jgi:hypothetical protein
LRSAETELAAVRLPGEQTTTFLLTGGGDTCPSTIGREPTSLPRLDEYSHASLMLNNQATCDSLLYQVVYFRGSPDGVAYVGIWRMVAENEYVLKHRIRLPQAPIGIHRINLVEPLHLERGDFLGVHYPRRARGSAGIVGHSDSTDGVIGEHEMFHTMVVDAYDEDVPQDRTFSLQHRNYRLDSRTFALQGLMQPDYSPGDYGRWTRHLNDLLSSTPKRVSGERTRPDPIRSDPTRPDPTRPNPIRSYRMGAGLGGGLRRESVFAADSTGGTYDEGRFQQNRVGTDRGRICSLDAWRYTHAFGLVS